MSIDEQPAPVYQQCQDMHSPNQFQKTTSLAELTHDAVHVWNRLAHNVVGAWTSIGGGRGDASPHFSARGGQHKKCPPPHLISPEKYGLIARLIAPLSLKLYIGLVVKLIIILRYKLPTTQWKITRYIAWLAAACNLILVQ